MLKRPVIGRLGLLRKAAPGQLPHLQMIADTIAADPFSGTGFVGTIAEIQICFLFTVHTILLMTKVHNKNAGQGQGRG